VKSQSEVPSSHLDDLLGSSVDRRLGRGWVATKHCATNALQHTTILSSFGSIDIDTGGGLYLNPTEKGREEELIAGVAHQGQSAIALFEAAEFSGISCEWRSSVVIIVTVC